jgi:predicted TIM-barrel fold metal-dependent hydrolase
MKRKNLLTPSALIADGRIYFQCGEELTTRRDIELLGDQCLIWASDFPHEGILDMAAAVKEFLTREDVPAESKRKIANENARRLYGLR